MKCATEWSAWHIGVHGTLERLAHWGRHEVLAQTGHLNNIGIHDYQMGARDSALFSWMIFPDTFFGCFISFFCAKRHTATLNFNFEFMLMFNIHGHLRRTDVGEKCVMKRVVQGKAMFNGAVKRYK